MIIIIPIGGTGQRFKEKGNDIPKSLISVDDKPIISYLLDNLNTSNIDYIFIPYNNEYKQFAFEEFLYKQYPNIQFKFFCLEHNTRGAAETINIGIDKLNEEGDIPVMCLDSDNFYTCDIISMWNGENCIFSFKDLNKTPIFSYVKTSNNDEILNIKEKEKISNNACTGAYGFKSIKELKKYTSKIIDENITQKGEFYTSGVIMEMLNDGHVFKNIEILNKNYFSLGTPEQVDEYMSPFLFDLDGTLVNTDDIYTNVWNEIMKNYDLTIDSDFFNFFIQGKNDILFMKEIFPDINVKEIDEISDIKDELVIRYLKNSCDTDIFVDGAEQFINENKNRRMCVVTSCNKKSAEYILKHTKISDYMQFVLASEDCSKHKPNKEPYEQAINILKCNKEKCTIFEDSYSGYKSALTLGGTKICIILNNNSSQYIINSNEYKIKSYHDFDINKLHPLKYNNIIEPVKNSLKHLFIKDIILNSMNLKTGYICDIQSIQLIFYDKNENIILKIENQENELSSVARKINLYNNEVYFYEKISKIINIETPKFYSSLKINDKNTILLEDLNDYDGCFNINLNTNIDVILNVVKSIADLHNRFYFETPGEVTRDMLSVNKINDIVYYKELIKIKFNKFIQNNNVLLSIPDKDILNSIYTKYNELINCAGTFPLNLCHGDLKSPNIFYKKNNKTITPVFLDWQYIHLNKGISDIAFLLVESTDFNEEFVDIIIKYYFYKTNHYTKFNDLLFDFKVSLCIFPFFVMVWFGSENREYLLDKVFPIRFMKNTLKFYNKYLDNDFFNSIQ